MNPWSPLTYYRRHRRMTALLFSIICAGTVGLYLLGALSLAIFYTPDHAGSMFLSNFAAVVPIEGTELDPTVVAQIRANPDVARLIPVKSGIEIEVPDPVRGDTDFYLLGLQETDVGYVLEKNGLALGEGRFPQPRAGEIILSQQLAAALGLQVGDTIDRSVKPELYEDILEPMELVGIMAGDVRLAIIPYEYLNDHELYRDRAVSAFLVAPKEGRLTALDDFLVNEIQSRQTAVQTLQLLREQIAEDNLEFITYGTPISILMTVVIAVVIGVINQIALAKRLPEFGILHATGHSKKWLTRRLTLEISVLAALGWTVGITLSWLILYLFKVAYFAPHGHELDPLNLIPLPFAIPVPLAVVGLTVLSARRVFARLDAVAIVERRELGTEKSLSLKGTESSPKPLAAATFYKRHKRRAITLIGAMAAAIMMVSFLIFNFAITADAGMVSLNKWKHMSLVQSEVGPLDPGITTWLRMHPSVERVVPTVMLYPLTMDIPPFSDASIQTFGLSAEDMAYVVELFDLGLKEGRLPRAYTNEIVISEVTAQNCHLKVGDALGSYENPVYRDAPVLPTELVISGIFARPAALEDETWLSFASLEFLNSHAGYAEFSRRLIAIPRAGQKATLDDWLENELTSNRVSAVTYGRELARKQESTRSLILTIAVIESAVAIVIALSLAVLNYIFVSQRRSEFGVLNALGWHRLKLVWRAVRETAFTTTMAWGFSVALCCIVLLGLQVGVFTPLGLRFDFFNPTPWLSTLPIPIMVLVVTAGTIGRTLAKLDPVTIIEMR
jgi:ABC-type antimicrobial peptide transport system permease subunit